MSSLPYRGDRPVVWFHRRPTKGNQYCLYCGAHVGSGSAVPSDKEHLIGRRFVPLGAMDGDAFNFIFRACRECNALKAAAERHVSTVSLYTSPARHYDVQTDEQARRKAGKDFHPSKRGVLVQDAHESGIVRHQFGPATFTFNLTAPPQLQSEQALLLASMQVQAFFSLVTTLDPSDSAQLRLLPPDQITVLGFFNASDWGNPRLCEVAKRASPWLPRVQILSARGFFRALLRRSGDDEGWFWALEWNKSVRVVGVITLPDVTPALFANLPPLGWSPLPDGKGRVRLETPLRTDDDSLFAWDNRMDPPSDSA